MRLKFYAIKNEIKILSNLLFKNIIFTDILLLKELEGMSYMNNKNFKKTAKILSVAMALIMVGSALAIFIR